MLSQSQIGDHYHKFEACLQPAASDFPFPAAMLQYTCIQMLNQFQSGLAILAAASGFDLNEQLLRHLWQTLNKTIRQSTIKCRTDLAMETFKCSTQAPCKLPGSTHHVSGMRSCCLYAVDLIGALNNIQLGIHGNIKSSMLGQPHQTLCCC